MCNGLRQSCENGTSQTVPCICNECNRLVRQPIRPRESSSGRCDDIRAVLRKTRRHLLVRCTDRLQDSASSNHPEDGLDDYSKLAGIPLASNPSRHAEWATQEFSILEKNKTKQQEQTIPGIRNSDTGRSIADRNRKRLPDSPGAGISIGWTGTGSSTGRDSGAGRPFDSIRRRNPIRRKNSGKAVWSKSRRHHGTGSWCRDCRARSTSRHFGGRPRPSRKLQSHQVN